MFTWSLGVHVVEKSHQTITERIRDGRDVSLVCLTWKRCVIGLFNMEEMCHWFV